MSGIFEVTWTRAKGAHLRRQDSTDGLFDWTVMENVYAGHGSETGRVLCTVEFGLVCVRRASSFPNGHVNGSSQHEGHQTNGGVDVAAADGILSRNLLLKPKVLLESVAEIL